MKTKLLKKIRKRFSIIHYPNGIKYFNDFYQVDVVGLYDDELRYGVEFVELNSKVGQRPFCDRKADSERKAINILKDIIVKRLKKENPSLGKKRNSIKSNKIWFIK